jgi:ketosteroid isomerase-like protein
MATNNHDEGDNKNEAHVLEYLENIKSGDHEAAYAAFAEDAIWRTPPSLPWPGLFEGRRAIFDGYFAVDKGLFTTGMESYDLETRCVISAGDRVVIEMTHRSTGLNGKKYETDHCLVFEVRDGLIQSVHEYIDSLYLKEQMIDPA